MVIFLHIVSFLAYYSLACLGSGKLVYLALRVDTHKLISPISPLTNTAIAFLVGQAVLGNFWLLLALAGWFNPAMIIALTVVCFLIGIHTISKDFVKIGQHLRIIAADLQAESWSWKAVAFLSCGLCALWVTSLGRSMAGDGAAFYMALAKVTAHTHQLTPLPGFENFTGIGILGEMHYAALIALGSADAAQLFSWPIIISGSIVFMALGRLVGLGRRGQWIVLAMVFTSSAILWLSGDGKTDLFATALGVAGYFWIMQIHSAQQKTAIKLSGLFVGFALVAKLSYIPALGASVAFLFFWMIKHNTPPNNAGRTRITSSIILGGRILGWTIIAMLPHLAKNQILFDHPLVPFTSETPAWTNQVWYQASTVHRIILSYPLALIFGTYAGQYGNLSPLVLAFLPLAFLKPPKPNEQFTKLVQLTAAALLGMVVWIIMQPAVFAPRYTLATLLLFTLPTARGAEQISIQKKNFPLPNLGILCSILFTGVMMTSTFSNLVFFPSMTTRYVSGHLPECGRDPYYCKTLTLINRIAGSGERIFINIRQRYWLRPDLIQCLLTTPEIETFTRLPAGDAQWEYMYDRGFQYVVLFTQPETIHPIVSPDINDVPEWLRITRMNNDEDMVFRLESLDPSRQPHTICQETKRNVWEIAIP